MRSPAALSASRPSSGTLRAPLLAAPRRSAPATTSLLQRADPYLPPVWPEPGHPQQLHVDIRVDDADEAERAVLALGAARLHDASDKGFRVFADPAGHPFCLVF